MPRWRGYPLVAAVQRLVPGVPVSLAGDAQCMALGEWWRGGHGGSSLLGIVVSTGVGGGLIIDGRPWTGRTGNAGHIGHVVVDHDGERCVCGARGCLETIAGGPSMVRWALAQGWTHAPGRPDAKALAAAARAGASIPLAAFHRAARALATAILNTAAVLDVRDVVIGGGVAAAGDLLLAPPPQGDRGPRGHAPPPRPARLHHHPRPRRRPLRRRRPGPPHRQNPPPPNPLSSGTPHRV
ncbi:ROK family protein [Actinomadura madurae]|nr:ROK family protein [Actinomadura madurae]